MPRTRLEDVDTSYQMVLDNLKIDMQKLRSGRANPDLVSDIKVSSYGQMMPLNQLANINVADPTLLVVQVWDKTNLDEVEKAIKASDIGITPLRDGEIIRLPLPPLTEERRVEYVKLLKQKVEEARIQVRQIRKDILLGLEEQKDAGQKSEDDMKRNEKTLQEKVDEYNLKIEEMAKDKEEELMRV